MIIAITAVYRVVVETPEVVVTCVVVVAAAAAVTVTPVSAVEGQ